MLQSQFDCHNQYSKTSCLATSKLMPQEQQIYKHNSNIHRRHLGDNQAFVSNQQANKICTLKCSKSAIRYEVTKVMKLSYRKCQESGAEEMSNIIKIVQFVSTGQQSDSPSHWFAGWSMFCSRHRYWTFLKAFSTLDTTYCCGELCQTTKYSKYTVNALCKS